MGESRLMLNQMATRDPLLYGGWGREFLQALDLKWNMSEGGVCISNNLTLAPSRVY